MPKGNIRAMPNRRQANRKFADSAFRNTQMYHYYLNRLIELATNCFKYEDLPDSVDARFLERTLNSEGVAVWFHEDGLDGLVALTVALNGKWNIYNTPTSYRAYATNGYQQELTDKNSVLMWNNYNRTGILNDLEMYANRLAELDRTMDTNVILQKTPAIVKCTETQRLTLVNLFKQYEGNIPFIYATKDLDLNGVEVIDMKVPYVCDKLNTYKRQMWAEVLAYLGIEAITSEKSERLVKSESSSMQGVIKAQRANRLDARKEAVEKINKMFGTDIKVEFNEQAILSSDQALWRFAEDDTDREVSTIERLYDTSQIYLRDDGRSDRKQGKPVGKSDD